LGYTANKAYFAITDATHGQELWAANLTTGTIALTKDILVGSGGALSGTDSGDVNMIGDKIVFDAYSSATNQGLFVSDGTTAGTVQLASSFTDKAIIGNKVFFVNSSGVSVSDVSAATVSAIQLKTGNFSVLQYSTIDKLQSDSDQAFFLGADEKLYASTGADVIELASNVDKFKVVADNAIYFIETNSSNVASLWYSDGTAAGTRYIEDLTMSASDYALANAVAIHTVGVAS
jgi:ELWxxDGT repeat protein